VEGVATGEEEKACNWHTTHTQVAVYSDLLISLLALMNYAALEDNSF
jgi:hypothetical protein